MKKQLRVGVFGAGGRVGKELLGLLKTSSEFIPSYGVGSKAQGFETNVESLDSLKGGLSDLYIDFSSPELLEKVLPFCLKEKKPLVSGTTGLSEIQFAKLKEASRHIPILWSPNMSLGIATLKKALSVFKGIKSFDFQVEEWHHRHKKDSPSGTAIYLQKALEEVIDKKCPPAMVMRGGGIFGVHKVYAASDEEIIQFEHTAINRTVFARGALEAALWLKDREAGFYSMDDVIS